MIRRVVWLAVGVAGAIVVARLVTRAGDHLSPGGMVHGWRGAIESAREFGDDVRTGMREHERYLRATLLDVSDR